MATIDIANIKSSESERNRFIEAYRPFIANCVYTIVSRRVEYGVDEELSVALLAFNHAIDRFDGRGSFLSFAKLVIKNRLYDYYRSTARHIGNEPLFTEEETENAGVVDKAMSIYREDDGNTELKEEIAEFSQKLNELGIDFYELVKIAPKHKVKRKKLGSVVSFILNNEEANRYFLNSKNLPLKLIEENLDISRKNIESYRKYIIAMVVVANSDFYYLKEYLSL